MVLSASDSHSIGVFQGVWPEPECTSHLHPVTAMATELVPGMLSTSALVQQASRTAREPEALRVSVSPMMGALDSVVDFDLGFCNFFC